MPQSIHDDPDEVTEPRRVTAAEMRRRLTVKFGRTLGSAVVVPEYMVLYEVGARQSQWKLRRIDVVAVGLLKRTQHLIHGFEIKVSRADLLSELREPAKGAAGAALCDRWWLALSDLSLLKPKDEIPAGWGVLYARGRGLHIHKEPAPIDRVDSPEFRAALLHATQRSPSYSRAMGWQAGYQRATDEARRREMASYERGMRDGRRAAQYDAEQAERATA